MTLHQTQQQALCICFILKEPAAKTHLVLLPDNLEKQAVASRKIKINCVSTVNAVISVTTCLLLSAKSVCLYVVLCKHFMFTDKPYVFVVCQFKAPVASVVS